MAHLRELAVSAITYSNFRAIRPRMNEVQLREDSHVNIRFEQIPFPIDITRKMENFVMFSKYRSFEHDVNVKMKTHE